MITLSKEQLLKLLDASQDAIQDFVNDEGEPKDDAAQTFIKRLNSRISDLRDEAQEQGFKAGERKKAQAIERELAPMLEKYGIKADRAEDAIASLRDKIKDAGKSADGDLTPEKIRSLPAFQEELDRETEKLKKDRDKWKTDFEQYKEQQARQAVAHKARSRGEEILEEMKAEFGPNRNGRLNFFWNAVGMDAIHLNDKGEIEVVDAEGNPMRNADNTRMTFQDFVVSNWTNAGLGFNETQGNGNPALPADKKGGSDLTITSPEELDRHLQKANTPEEKAKAQRAYAQFLVSKKD